MSRPNLLALTSEQLGVVMRGAGQLSPRWRQSYLQGVADELLHAQTVNDAAVTAAVQIIVERMSCPTPPAAA